jgi:tRNA A37 methylthiotransferase MiaB
MGQKSGLVKEPAERVVKEIRRAARRQFSAEEEIGIVVVGCVARTASPSCAAEGDRPEPPLPLVEGVPGGRQKKRLAGDTARGRPRTRSRICAAKPAR